jgi:uncharacterized phosphatase
LAQKICERTARFPDGVFPNQESRESVTERAMNGLTYIVNNFSEENIIIVSHGAVINSILFELSNGEIGTGKTILNNCCMNFLTYTDNEWNIDEYNSDKHLRKII